MLALAHKRERQPYRAYATADSKLDIRLRTEAIEILDELQGMLKMQSRCGNPAARPQMHAVEVRVRSALQYGYPFED